MIEHTYEAEISVIKNTTLYSFKFIDMDIEYKVDSYKSMLIGVIRILDSISSEMMDYIAKDYFTPWKDGKYARLTSTTNSNENKPVEIIRDNLFLIGSFSAKATLLSIKKLMAYYNIDKTKFLFYTI